MREQPAQTKGILKLVSYSAGLQQGKFLWIILILLLAGVLEGLGMLTLFPLLQLVVDPGAAATLPEKFPLLSLALGKFGVGISLFSLVGLVCAGIFGKAVLLYFGMRLVTAAVSNVMANLRGELARRSLEARWPYFQNRATGMLVNRLTNECYKAGSVFYYACQICANLVQVLVYALLSLYLSWQLTLVAGLGALLTMLLLHHFVRVTRESGRRQIEVLANISAKFTDYLQGIKPLKAMGREFRLRGYLEREIGALNEAQQSELMAIETMKIVQEPVMVALIAGLLLYCAVFAPSSLPSLLTLAVIFQRLLSRTNLLQQNIQNCASGETAFWWVLGDIAAAKKESENASGVSSDGKGFRLEKNIEWRKLHFAHGEKEILHGISLTLPARGFTLLKGPSGAGKTSFIDILCRLQLPASGDILVDGQPLNQIPLAEWRAAIGYVPQEMFLLNDTLRNNLTLGDTRFSDGELKKALQQAGALAFVDALQNGLDSPLGERGTSLSGGQRQRISLARALLGSPKILILDEVTASLDPVTEEEICASLLDIAKTTCVIAISHQQAFVKKANIVYTLRDGKLEAPPA